MTNLLEDWNYLISHVTKPKSFFIYSYIIALKRSLEQVFYQNTGYRWHLGDLVHSPFPHSCHQWPFPKLFSLSFTESVSSSKIKVGSHLFVSILTPYAYMCASSVASVTFDSLWPARLLCHGILQARILEWVVIPFSMGSSWPSDRTHVSWTAGGFFTTEQPGTSPYSTVI